MCTRLPAPWAAWIHWIHAAGGASGSTAMVVMFVVCLCCVLQSHSSYIKKYQSLTLRYAYCLTIKLIGITFLTHPHMHHAALCCRNAGIISFLSLHRNSVSSISWNLYSFLVFSHFAFGRSLIFDLFCAPAISIVVRGYISSSSLWFANTRFKF